MTSTAVTDVRPVLPFTRVVLLVSAILSGIAGIQLYVLTDHTDHFFAWTIASPLSATFLGTGYWTGTLLLLFALREHAWANIRLAMAAVAPFVPLMLLTTLLHLNLFHFQSGDLGGRVAAWAWIIVYIVVPIAVLALFVIQLGAPGGDPPAIAPAALWIRVLLGINGAVALMIGVALMLTPAPLLTRWPWQLTPLTAQGIGTGFVAVASASAWFIHENAWGRGRVGTVPYLIFGVLNVVALLRYAGKVAWDRPGAWLYVLFMAGVVFGGIYSTMVIWGSPSRRAVLDVPAPRQS